MLKTLRPKTGGFSLIQAMVAAGIVALAGAAGIVALTQINEKAAAMRTLNNARAVVQRNIDAALAASLSASVQPTILALTGPAGTIHDDDGGNDNKVTIVVPKAAAGPTIRGTLTRTVTEEANADGADIRRVTFRIDYAIAGRPYTYQMTTLKGAD